MRKCVWNWCLALGVLAFGATAHAGQTLSLERQITGLDEGGFFIPGTSQLSVTVTINSVDEAGENSLTALGVKETLPAGWTFVGGSTTGANVPDVRPANGASGQIGWAYITPPSFPASFSYTVNVTNPGAAGVNLTGFVEYRFGGPAISSAVASTLVQTEPTLITATREVSGSGLTGASNQFYVPGGQINVVITLSKSGPDAITALGFEDTVPAGWTYSSASLVGPNVPDVRPANGASGTLGFAYISAETFPISFGYTITVPGNATGAQSLLGVGKYRTGGPEILTNNVNLALSAAPCVTVSQAGASGNFYVAGQNLVITVTLDSNCTSNITALGIEQTIPAGWAFVGGSITGAVPDVRPANGATGTLGFAYIAPPSFPASFNYTVTVPALEEGDRTVTGLAKYRLGGPELLSEVATTVFSGEDVTPPVITLVGSATVTLECGSNYTEEGATASDDRDGDITGSVVVDGTVDTATPGVYLITYDVVDVAGNVATTVTREVTVDDTTAPVITRNGDEVVIVNCGSSYVDAGATVADNCDNSVVVNSAGAVNTAVTGDYTITYTATDASGNAAVAVTRTVTVVDVTAPVITRTGAASVTISCGSVYNDLGATATDTCDGNVAVVANTAAVNTAVPGSYQVTYNASDLAGNAATQVTRTVIVTDTTPPTVTRNGAATVTVACGSAYTELGATATDLCDSTLTVVTTGTVNTAVPGNYTITYSATDDSGNTGSTTRTVTVSDTTAPVITRNGDAVVTHQCGTAYTDAGGTATDVCDSSITVTTNAATAVNTAVPGTYTVTLSGTDDSGNTGTTTRTVNVVDTTLPVITLTGAATIVVECGSVYTDAGAVATDSCDSSVSVVATGAVNTAVPGVYTITYNAADDSGNAAVAVVRTVTVSDSTAPVISVTGSASVTVECGDAYSDAGATATDSCDGDLSASVVTGGDVVDTTTPGTYTVTYTVADGAGNAANASRSVVVIDTTNPVVVLNGDPAPTIECGGSFTDEGATATDSCDASVTVTVSGAVNTSVPGTYNVTYSATDASGNTGNDIRVVTVVDTTLPVITINGSSPVTVNCGDSYTDAGATATDSCQGTVAVVSSGTVNTGVEGTQTITYTATDNAGNTATAVRIVNVVGPCEENVCEDTDENGISDDLFGCLDTDGESISLVVPGGDCLRAVTATTWFGDNTVGDVTVSLANPEDANQVLTVTVPRSVIGAGQQAIVIVSIACDVISLLGDEAFNLATIPGGEAAGNSYFDISIIVTSDGGASYQNLDDAALAGNPVLFSINGLAFTPGLDVEVKSHDTTVQDDSTTGAKIYAGDDVWSSDEVENVVVDGTSVSGEATGLSVFAVFEQQPAGPAFTVTPNPNYDLVFGIVKIDGGVATATVRVTNSGKGGNISGAASITGGAGAFTITGATAYSLAAGASQDIQLRFDPSARQEYTATLTLTNDAGAPVLVTLKGTGTLVDKRFTVLGCGPATGTGSPMADLAMISVVFAGLMLSSRAFRRAKQS